MFLRHEAFQQISTQSFDVDACNERIYTKRTRSTIKTRADLTVYASSSSVSRSLTRLIIHSLIHSVARSLTFGSSEIFVSAICSIWMILFLLCHSIRINVFRFANKHQLFRSKFDRFFIRSFSSNRCYCCFCFCCCLSFRLFGSVPKHVCVCLWIYLFLCQSFFSFENRVFKENTKKQLTIRSE